MTSRRGHPEVVFIHSSDEMFGADRILLEVVGAGNHIDPHVWLPDDVELADDPLHIRLRERGVDTTIRSLPILRRRHLTPRHFPRLVLRAIRLWVDLRRVRPSAVYCATSATLLAAPVARLAGVRVVVLHVQEIWSRREASVLGIFARAATTVVAISEPVRSALPRVIADRTRVIINASADVVDPAPRPILSGGGISIDRPLTFLVASRWNSWKGYATLLKAWDSISPPPGRLLIAGSPPEVGLAVDVPHLVSKLRTPGSVEIVGQMTTLTDLIDSVDVVVVPSDDPEPFGLVAIEAFGRYRPVIASSGGGLGQIVDDGRTGILFENRSVPGLAAALSSLDRARASEFGLAARADFDQRYSMDRFAAAIMQLWNDTLSSAAK